MTASAEDVNKGLSTHSTATQLNHSSDSGLHQNTHTLLRAHYILTYSHTHTHTSTCVQYLTTKRMHIHKQRHMLH